MRLKHTDPPVTMAGMNEDERRAQNRERMARRRAEDPNMFRKRDREAKRIARRLDTPYAQPAREIKRSPQARARRNELRRRPESRARQTQRLRRPPLDPGLYARHRGPLA